MTVNFKVWKIEPDEHGWLLFAEGEPQGPWWAIYFAPYRPLFPTLEDVFARIREENK